LQPGELERVKEEAGFSPHAFWPSLASAIVIAI